MDQQFPEKESWLNDQGNQRLNPDNMERPKTKWVFVKFSNFAVKIVLSSNRSYAHARCQTGCVTLLGAVGQKRSGCTLSMTTYVFGSA